MAEDKTAFERECDTRRSDLARIQHKRIQEFDLLTTTAGLDLIHIVHATEPNSPVDAAVSPPDRRPAAAVSASPAAKASPPQPAPRTSPRPTPSTADAYSPGRSEPTKTLPKNQRSSSGRVVPQYVPAVLPKPKSSPGKSPPDTTTRL